MTDTAGTTTSLTDRPAYRALAEHVQELRRRHLRELFADDPGRAERMTVDAAGVFLDYSKNRVTDETLRLLVELAEQSGLRERIDAMFAGEHINITEDRAVLHVALRAPAGTSILVDGADLVPERAQAPLPRGAGVGHRLERREGLGGDDEKGLCRVEVYSRLGEVGPVDV